jgi:hypothetical protein
MASRFIIGRGELLTFDIPPPPIKSDKARPYTLDQARAHLVPQMLETAKEVFELPDAACPAGYAVAKVDLHPTFIAKSFFPRAFLRQAGLVSLGSKTVMTTPRVELRRTAPESSESTQLLVAGSRENFARLPGIISDLAEMTPQALQFAEIEDFETMRPVDRMRPGVPEAAEDVFEVGLHLLPDESVSRTQEAFVVYANKCDFRVHTELAIPVGGMLFLPVRGAKSRLFDLALFTLMRVVRPMPPLRSFRPMMRASPLAVPFRVPTAEPLSDEPAVAVLDGGLPKDHVLNRFVEKYVKSDPSAGDVSDFLDHGLGVTSALLFGPIEPGEEASRPYSYVDHYRVLDQKTDNEDHLELFRTLGHIEEVLLSRQYQFVNLSLGPELPMDDDDVHAWTALIDDLLSDGETLLTVAAGNNGDQPKLADLNRIQVPADSVNALSVGACTRSGTGWSRANYSAIGPGRSPGRRKPDVVAFGGSPKEYFHIAAAGKKPTVATTMGTSFASPLTLRSGIGVRAYLGESINALTIRALLVHAAHVHETESPEAVGWGRVPTDVSEMIVCPDGMARIIYQGRLKPGKYLRARVPLPKDPLQGMVTITATFCYASPVDVEDAAAYTKAGLGITFRPNAGRPSGKQAKTRSFFSAREFRTELEQRSDLGKWETVMHASERMRGSSLHEATFDIHYNAREGGASAAAGSELIPYALVLTVEAARHPDLYSEILRAHSVLKAIEPRITLPVRVST